MSLAEASQMRQGGLRAVLVLLALVTLVSTTLFPSQAVAAPSPQAAPAGEHWAYVSLTTQRIYAMNGQTPVYVGLVTTGKPGSATPRGSFRIVRRVANETMDSQTIGIPRRSPYGYYLPNVLFTQYFTWEGHALHLNYWAPESVFGQTPTSHGCVGMGYADARFFWTFLQLGDRVVLGD